MCQLYARAFEQKKMEKSGLYLTIIAILHLSILSTLIVLLFIYKCSVPEFFVKDDGVITEILCTLRYMYTCTCYARHL